MISFEPLWKTLNSRGLTTYDLIFRHGLSANTVHRMKHNQVITTKTLNELCLILHCPIGDIITYVESDDD